MAGAATADPTLRSVVHLSVIPNPDATDVKHPYLLEMYPRRYGDTLLFFDGSVPGGKKASTSKPREVLWMAYNVPANFQIELTPKPKTTAIFNPPYPVLDNKTTSAHLKPQAGPDKDELDVRWSYNATLRNLNDNSISDQIDPEVIIKNDP